MRALTTAVLAAFLLVATNAADAHAVDFVKGDGYRIQIPDGYVGMDLPGGMLESAQGQITANLPTKGTPELKVFIRGEEFNPESVIVISRVDLKMGAWNRDALSAIEADAHQYMSQLGAGVALATADGILD